MMSRAFSAVANSLLTYAAFSEMWETLFYQQLTKDVTFHRFDTPPSKA